MGFKKYRLDLEIIKSLDLLEYKVPTKVQEEVIPLLLKNKDVVCKAKTGSGKTASFLIPILQNIELDNKKPQVLVLSPTRELALQIRNEASNIGKFKRLKAVTIFGKDSFEKQVVELKQRNHIICATPGRIYDHLEKGTIDLSEIKYLIIDEADEMLAMDFIDQINYVLNVVPSDTVIGLFSATLKEEIKVLIEENLKEPYYVEIKQDTINIEQLYTISKDKLVQLVNIIFNYKPELAIVFCNTQKEVDNVFEFLKMHDFNVQRIHGGLDQDARIKIINGIKRKKFRILVATDVASRGIDIDKVSLVINYDLANNTNNYLHRIGRTGRVLENGLAISLVDDLEMLKKLEKELNYKLIQTNVDMAKEKDIVKYFSQVIKKVQMPNEKINAEVTRLHLNAGKKQKLRPVDFVGAICSIDNVTANDIGVISINEVASFIEILNEKGNLVYQALKEKPIKGKIRKVSIANKEWFNKD